MANIDEDHLDACLRRIKAAWDAGDAHAYAAEFSADATYVTWMGDALVGQGEIESMHADVFGKWRTGPKMGIKRVSIRSLGPGTASLLTVGGLGDGEPIRYDKLQTLTFVEQDGRWLCSAFHNTKMSARAEEAANCW